MSRNLNEIEKSQYQVINEELEALAEAAQYLIDSWIDAVEVDPYYLGGCV